MKISLNIPVSYASEALITLYSKAGTSPVKKELESYLEKIVSSGKSGKLTFENKKEFDAWLKWTASHRVNPLPKKKAVKKPVKKSVPVRATVKKTVKKRGKA